VKESHTVSVHGMAVYLSVLTVSYLHTYSMEQSPYWEANWSSASQEIPCILWNL